MGMMFHSDHVSQHPLLEFVVAAQVVIDPKLHVPRVFEAGHASEGVDQGRVCRWLVEPVRTRQEGRSSQLRHEQVTRMQWEP